MIKFGQVQAYDKTTGEATIVYMRPDACAKCGACGGGGKSRSIRLKADCAVGDWVKVELPDGRHFIADLIGLDVLDADSGEKLGVVADVLTPPAHEVYVVKGEHEYMIPAVDEFLVETSVEGGYLKVRLIEGMRTDV